MSKHREIPYSFACAILCLCLCVSCGDAGGLSASTLGQATAPSVVTKWHRATIDFVGPTHDEMDNDPNPFLDYRLQVTFTAPSGNTYNVPGFFDGDGDGGGTGSVWRVHFGPDEVGTWTFQASFREGTDIAVDLDPTAGTPTSFDGEMGSFDALPLDPNAKGFLSLGRLQSVNEHHFKFADAGYWIKTGMNVPENFLGYEGFDSTPFANHQYAVHEAHWQPGDPDWDSPDRPGTNDGRAIIGALNYLNSQGINSIYFMPMNIGADGEDVWPYADPNINRNGSPSNDNVHMDISKLAQWDTVLDHAQAKEIFLHFVLSDKTAANKNEIGLTLGVERKLYYRELVARFGHHNALQWNISEEYNLALPLDPDLIKEFAQYVVDVDPYGHAVTVHPHGNTFAAALAPFVGDERFEVFSVQTWQQPENVEFAIELFRNETTNAGNPIPIMLDECIGFDQISPAEHRKRVTWDALMSGGGFEFFKRSGGDTSFDDFTELEEHMEFAAIARSFLETELPFWEMQPNDDLVSGEVQLWGGAEVFFKANEAYAVYFPDASGATTIDLSSSNRELERRWFNPRTGMFEGDTDLITPSASVNIGPPPSEPSEDWVVLFRPPLGSNAPPQAFEQSIVTARDTPAPLTLNFTDLDGPGPNTFEVLVPPTKGTLSPIGSDGSVTYTPNAGETGADSFRWKMNDGLEDSTEATVSILIGGQVLLLEDDFNRADSATLGNGWQGLEASGASVGLVSGAMQFTDTSDASNRPLVAQAFVSASTGVLQWSFQFDWARAGNEGVYQLFMQLGDSFQLQPDNDDAGVAVNLTWTQIGGVHETLGYRQGGTNTALAVVSGVAQVDVTVDLDAGVYEVSVNDAVVGSGIGFDNAVSTIDTMRFFTDGLNEENFDGLRFDDIEIRQIASGVNRAPVASDQSVETLVDTPVDIVLQATDANGDPLQYIIVDPPLSGFLQSDDGDDLVTYVPDPGVMGSDSFTFVADDGMEGSNIATVDILVDDGNDAPVASDQTASTSSDTLVALTLSFTDLDGPGPNTFEVLVPPTKGTLSPIGSDGSVTYTPNAGETGADSFRWKMNDGLEDSTEATVSLLIGDEVVLIDDDFNRADSATLGNGWQELEASGASVGLVSGAMQFTDTSDASNRPLVAQAFVSASTGVLQWSFQFDWARAGNEGVYQLFMQLGDSFQLQPDNDDAGVAVNLTWTQIGGVHETLGYRQGGTNTALAVVSGVAQVDVTVDLDAGVYEVSVNDAVVGSGIGFDNAVSTIDTMRFFTDGLNEENFDGLRFDDIEIRQIASGVNRAPVASDQSVETLVDTPVDIVLQATDANGDPLQYIIVDPPLSGFLQSDDGDDLVTYVPDPGVMGSDSFTFVADDGMEGSNIATVDILVDDGNDAPVASDQTASTSSDTLVALTLSFTDLDGPGPNTFEVLVPPTKGTLSPIGSDGSVTYTPNAGETGADSFRWKMNDGLEDSTEATVSLLIGDEVVLIDDDFNRADSATLGNGWQELEASGASVGLVSGAMQFTDTSDASNRPLVAQAFVSASTGVLQWSFQFDWARAGNEGVYQLFMQLGDSFQLQPDNDDAGVAVNLTWTQIGGVHETLGYRQGGTNTALAVVSGVAQVDVTVDLDAGVYEVSVNDAVVGSGIGFDNAVSTIDTMRFFTDGLNEENFSGEQFDDVSLTSVP